MVRYSWRSTPDQRAIGVGSSPRPVYRFAADFDPGDVNGQGVSGVWYVIGADGEPITG